MTKALDDLRPPLIPDGDLEDNGDVALCVDEMLTKYCGEFGFWQLKHFVLTCLGWSLEAFHTMVMIFADQQPSWSCIAPAGCTSVSVCGDSWRWDGGQGRSTVSEWGLVCDQKYKVGLVQAVFFGGCMIGSHFNLIFFICHIIHHV